jgi:hypothetical protein
MKINLLPAELDVLKERKIKLLSSQCDQAIQAGFQSSALGVPHTYPAGIENMIYFNSTLLRFNNDPSFTSLQQLTLDAGYLDHTKEQFIQVFNDGHQFGLQQDGKLEQLKTQVSQAQSPDDLDNIKW